MGKTIVCFGDSNTWGYDPGSFFGDPYPAGDRWPELLAERTGYTVINEGQNGRRIPFTCPEMRDAVRRIGRVPSPDLLILMLGTNDLLGESELSPEQAGERMAAFLHRLREELPALPILLIAPPKVELPLAWLQQAMRDLADVYRELAVKEGLFFASVLGWELPLAFDGVHLSPAANHGFAEALERFLKEEVFP